MFKYGDILQPTNGNSKTLYPRNLSYSKVSNTQTITTSSSNTVQSSGNFNSASITDLTINSINIIPNTSATNIIISSPVAFSLTKDEYELNNFFLYPIFFSRDIFIQNKNFILQSNNVTIKDNVILLNSTLTTTFIDTNRSDSLISGFIFPIADQNISTGFYAGLLYVPNNKIAKINPTSNVYNWTNNQFNYFTNNLKGFFKLKYLPQSLSFSNFNNTMDQNYTELINNNVTLANLHINAIALQDGEIVGLNDNLALNLSDGTTIYKLIQIDKLNYNILNNLGLRFVNNLIISDINNNKFISLDTVASLITFYKNIAFNNSEYIISFNNILYFNYESTNIIKITGPTKQTEINGTVLIDNLKVIGSFQLNNIPFTFINSLSIVSNNLEFILFDSVLNKITFYKPTIINTLIVLESFNINNNIPLIFNLGLYIQDINKINYIYFDGIQKQITCLVPTKIGILTINNSFELLNDISIFVLSKFTIQTKLNIFAIFDINNLTLQNNILFNTTKNPKISFQQGKTLNISDTNQTINLDIDTSVTITGPNTSYQDISNTIVYSSFNITNTSAIDYNLTFTPISKIYIASGITQNNGKILFKFQEVLTTNNMSGKLTGTTWGLNSLFVNTYDINLWSYPIIVNHQQATTVGYNTLNPINPNNGNWYINNIYLLQDSNNNYNLNVECIGSIIDRIVWGFKLDILQI